MHTVAHKARNERIARSGTTVVSQHGATQGRPPLPQPLPIAPLENEDHVTESMGTAREDHPARDL
eukprot:10628972-Alexandrium_andersonii.AAC.1